MPNKDNGIDGGLIELSIWVDGRSEKDFELLKKLIVAKEQISKDEAAKLGKIIKDGYVTSCAYTPADKYNKRTSESYELVGKAFPNGQIHE